MKGKIVSVVVFAVLAVVLVGFAAQLTNDFTNFRPGDINEAARQLFGM